MHVCMDEYLRTEALAESSSKTGIIEPPLLQVRMKTISSSHKGSEQNSSL